MTILFLAPELKSDPWVKHLRLQEPGLEVRVWPEVGRTEEILLALCWRHPSGELLKYENLRCVASLGFGVDHILRDPDLPPGVPITRIVDPAMIAAMSEYILAAVFLHARQFGSFARDQARRKWQPRRPLHPADLRVGIMGLGHLGADAADKLRLLGVQVSGWSRTPKRLEGVTGFTGDEGLEAFLAQADVLVCLLPLTPATEGILNRRTLSLLPPGAYVINVARGEHIVEEDLLAALESGQVSGACLDVFRKEPLPENHPFWSAPGITVTPHVASLTYPKAVAPQLIESYRRVRSGRLPLNVIDTRRGY
jgi:glyoxylate/hydroxypyruvate reductase A